MTEQGTNKASFEADREILSHTKSAALTSRRGIGILQAVDLNSRRTEVDVIISPV